MINLSSNPFDNTNFFNAQAASTPDPMNVDTVEDVFDYQKIVDAKQTKQFVADCLANNKIELLKKFYEKIDEYQFWIALSSLAAFYRQDKVKAIAVFAELGPLLQGQSFRTWTSLSDVVELFLKDPLQAQCAYIKNPSFVFEQVYENYAERVKNAPASLIPSDQILALVFGDGFIKGTKYEGAPFASTVAFLVSYLKYFSENQFFPETNLGKTISDFEELLGVLQNIKAAPISTLSEILLNRLRERGRVIIPGGWIDKFGGHAMIYVVEREPSANPLGAPTYSFSIYTTGAGSEYHLGKRVRNTLKIVPCETIPHIPAEKIENTALFEYLLTLESVLPKNTVETYNQDDIYPVLFNYFDYTPQVTDSPTDLFSVPQTSGTCTWKVLLAFIRTSLGSSFCEKLKFHLKTLMLFMKIKERNTAGIANSTLLVLNESLIAYHFAALRAFHAGAISFDDFYIAHSFKHYLDIPQWESTFINEAYLKNSQAALEFPISMALHFNPAASFTLPPTTNFSLAKLSPSLNCQNPEDLIDAMDRLITDGGSALRAGSTDDLWFILFPLTRDLPPLDHFETLVNEMDEQQLSLARTKFKELVILLCKISSFGSAGQICRAYLHIINYLLHRGAIREQLGDEVFDRVVFIDPAMNLKDAKFHYFQISYLDQINEFHKKYPEEKSIYYNILKILNNGKVVELECYEFDNKDPKYVLYDIWKYKNQKTQDPFDNPRQFAEFFHEEFLGEDFRNYLEVNFLLKTGSDQGFKLVFDPNTSSSKRAVLLCTHEGKCVDVVNFNENINQPLKEISKLRPPLEIKRIMDFSYVRLPLLLTYFEKNINFLLTRDGTALFFMCLWHYSFSDAIETNLIVRELKSGQGKKILEQLNRFLFNVAEFAKENNEPDLFGFVMDLEHCIKNEVDRHKLGEFKSAITEEHLAFLGSKSNAIQRSIYLAFLLQTKGKNICDTENGIHAFLEAYFYEPTIPQKAFYYLKLKQETARLEPMFLEKWSQIKNPSVYLDALCKIKFPDFQPGSNWHAMYPFFFTGDYLIDFDNRQILFQKNKRTSIAGQLASNTDYCKISWSTEANDFTETKLGFQSKTAGLEVRFMQSPVFVRTKEQLLRDFPNCHWPAQDFELDKEYLFIPAGTSKQPKPQPLVDLDLTCAKELPAALKSEKFEKWAAVNGSHLFLKAKGILYLIHRKKENRVIIRDVVEKFTLVNILNVHNSLELVTFAPLESPEHILVWESDEGDTVTFNLPRYGLTFTKSGKNMRKLTYLNQNYSIGESVRVLHSMGMLRLKTENGENILLLPKRSRGLCNQQNFPLQKNTAFLPDANPDSRFEVAAYRFRENFTTKTCISDCEASKQDLIFLIVCLVTATHWHEAIKTIKKCYQNYPFSQAEQGMILNTLAEYTARKGTLPHNASAAMCHLLWLLLESENFPQNSSQKFVKIYIDYIKNYNQILHDWRLTPEQEFFMSEAYKNTTGSHGELIMYHRAVTVCKIKGGDIPEFGAPSRKPSCNERLEIENLVKNPVDFSSLKLLSDFELNDFKEKFRAFYLRLDACFLNLVQHILIAHQQKDATALANLQLIVLNFIFRLRGIPLDQFYLAGFLVFLGKKGIGEIGVYEDLQSEDSLKAICKDIWTNYILNSKRPKVTNPVLLQQIFPAMLKPAVELNKLKRDSLKFNQLYLGQRPEDSSPPKVNRPKRPIDEAIPLEVQEGRNSKARAAKTKAKTAIVNAKKLTTKQIANKKSSQKSKTNRMPDGPFCLDASFSRLREKQTLTTSALQFYSALKKDYLEYAKPKEDYAFITAEFVRGKLATVQDEFKKSSNNASNRANALFARTFCRVYPNDSTETFRKKVVEEFVVLKTNYINHFSYLMSNWYLSKDQKDIKPHELEVYEEPKQIFHDFLKHILCDKIIRCGKQLLSVMESANQSGLRELQHTFHSLNNTTFFSDNEFDPHLPLKLYYQTVTGMILRPKQIETISKVDGTRQVALQLGCGEGKTKVLTVLFDLMNLREEKLVLNVLMPNNFKLNLAEFQRQANKINLFKVKVFSFHRNLNSFSEIFEKLRILSDAKLFGDVVVTEPKSIQSLGLKYIELLERNDSPNVLNCVQVMLDMIMDDSRCCAIMDEIHQLLKQQDQLNYALASGEWTPPKYRWQLPVQIVHALLDYNEKQENPADLLPIGQYSNDQFSQELYQDKIKINLARFLFAKAPEFGITIQTKNPMEKELWVKYLCSKAEHLSLEERKKLKAWENKRSPDECERLQLLRAHLLVYLKHTLTARCFVNYGPSDQTHQPVPYKYNMFPEEKNRFEYYDTLINLTCFMYLKTGLSTAQVKLFLEGWQQVHLNQRRALADKSEKTAIERRFASFIPERNLGTLNLEDKKVLDQITPKLAFNREIIFEFMRLFIFENLTTQERRLNSNAQDLAGTLLGRIIGFSGIFTNGHTFPIDMECKYNPGTYAKILSQLLDPHVASLACPQTPEEEAKVYAGAHVVLDPNAYHEGVANQVVAKTILATAAQEIQSILFYDELNEIKTLDRAGKVSPYNAEGDNPKSRITYYDHGHHEEVDIVQPDDGAGILLVNKNLTFTQLYQAAKRLRGLGAGQRLVVLVPKKVQNFLLQKIQEPITMENLITWTVMNEGEINEKTKLPALLDQLRNVYSSRLMKTLIKHGIAGETNQRDRLFARNKDLLIERQDMQNFKKIASLDFPLSDIQTFLTKAKELETNYHHLLLPEDREKLKRIMLKANEELLSPFEISHEGFFNATSQQEHEIQLENQVVQSQTQRKESDWDPEILFKKPDFVDNLVYYGNLSILDDHYFADQIYFSSNFLLMSNNPDWTKVKTEPYHLGSIEFFVEFETWQCSKILVITAREAEALRRWMMLNSETFNNFNVSLYRDNGDLLEKMDNAMSDKSIIKTKGNLIFAQINYLNGNLFCAEEVRQSMRDWTSANREYYDALLRKIQKQQVTKGIRKFITGLDPLFE